MPSPSKVTGGGIGSVCTCVRRAHLEERGEDHGAGVAKLEGGEQLWQHLVFAKVLRERVQVFTQVLEELLLLRWLFDLETHTHTHTHRMYTHSKQTLTYTRKQPLAVYLYKGKPTWDLRYASMGEGCGGGCGLCFHTWISSRKRLLSTKLLLRKPPGERQFWRKREGLGLARGLAPTSSQ